MEKDEMKDIEDLRYKLSDRNLSEVSRRTGTIPNGAKRRRRSSSSS